MTTSTPNETIQKLLRADVTEEHAMAVAKMSDKKLMNVWLVNAFPASLSGVDSVFWRLQAAIGQEIKRRGLKAKGMLA